MLFDLLSSAHRESIGLEDLIIEAQRVADSANLGGHRKRKSGTGEQFWQFRPYDTGSDTPQNIDWRQSAKSSRLEVRDQEWQIPQTTHIWCDGGTNMDYTSGKHVRTKSETAQILSLALALMITRGGDNIAAHGITAGHSKRTIEHFASALIENANTQTMPPLDIGKSRNSNMIMISDFWDDLDAFETRLSGIAESISRGFIIQIIDPAELDLAPYQGRTLFKDTGKNEQTDIPNVASIRGVYADKIKTHCRELKALGTRYGFTVTQHRTDHDIKSTLQALQGYAAL